MVENVLLNKPMPFFSVIVPVYNVQQYLRQCINSVLSQTFKDFEVIIIDDDSLDTSGSICDEAASMDDRIIVTHKSVNGGLGCARNTGLEKCNGQYVVFLDSDDFLTDNDALQGIWIPQHTE